jgi:succinyl-CoA synthetase beta subunit
MDYSCMLVEINPLCVTGDGGELLALDGKVNIDESALYRLPDAAAFQGELTSGAALVGEARASGFLYIPLTGGGRVAVVSNGSGMLMSMIDLLSKEGIAPACGLDLGGGATSARIAEAVRIVLSTPGVDTLFISIFGGVTRCDEVAAGLLAALNNRAAFLEGKGKPALRGKAAKTGASGVGVTVVLRMEGTNKDKGLEIAAGAPGVVVSDGLAAGVAAVKTAIAAKAAPLAPDPPPPSKTFTTFP